VDTLHKGENDDDDDDDDDDNNHNCEQLITLRMSDITLKYRIAVTFLNVDSRNIHIYTHKPVDIFAIYLRTKF
jgi:hypothetical protein